MRKVLVLLVAGTLTFGVVGCGQPAKPAANAPAKPADTKPADTKPADTKPADTKAPETK